MLKKSNTPRRSPGARTCQRLGMTVRLRTQLIAIPAGGLGVVSGTGIPARQFTINQGDKNFIVSGTGLTQPLTELFKIKAGNDVARAELNGSRAKARGVEDDVALKVRQLYYQILVVQSQHRAIE